MEEICRLCCSTKFVNNDIFDEKNALYIKMSLYLPIKVHKNDRLPQKVCDRCSCKVNDFYQFCNETIEVQSRLRAILLASSNDVDKSVDLTHIKDDASPLQSSALCEQSTQTDTNGVVVKRDIKEEPVEPAIIKQEEPIESDHSLGHCTDNSDDLSLITLKKKKRNKKELNGIDKKISKKKKPKLKDWEMLMNVLPEGTALSLVDKNSVTEVKQEVQDESEYGIPMKVATVKNEANMSDIFQCCICHAQCYRRTEMLKHYRQHAEQLPAVSEPAPPPPPDTDRPRCTRCRKEVSRGEWEDHWQKHWARDRRPYRCSLCEKSFRDHQQIFKHGLTHKSEQQQQQQAQAKRFVCDFCPEGFVYMRSLLAHRTRAHPEGATRPLALRCGTCARTFAHLNSLRRHQRAHSGERNYLCNVCGKALSSREHLKFHIRIHTGYKPNVCNTCGKGFVKKCNLTLHERVHSGEKPHVCSHCGKAFSQRSTLVIHERYHSGARPYVCGLCGRGFVAKGLLSMHLKTTCI